MAHDDDKMQELDQELEAAVAHDADEADERIETLTNELKRAQADFVNYKRRAEAEKAELLDFAKVRIVRDFLSVRDTFDQEGAHRPKDVDAKWAASIDSIRSQFDSVLKRLGVERFNSEGEAFDPHLHNAVSMQDGDGTHEVVAAELQPGYKLGDTVVRHAMVTVGHSDVPPPRATAETDPAEVLASEQTESDDVQPEAGK